MNNLLPLEKIENKILMLRDEKVMLDRDLAELYGVETRVLNQAVKRNKERFPSDFMFRLNRIEAVYLVSQGIIPLRSQIVMLDKKVSENKPKEKFSRSQFVTLDEKNGENKENLKSQYVTSSSKSLSGLHVKHLPYVFTEQGVAMLSSVLKSKKAIEVNIAIMRAFVKIRALVYSYKDLADKIKQMEKNYDGYIGKIFEILDKLMKEKEAGDKDEIGFKIN